MVRAVFLLAAALVLPAPPSATIAECAASQIATPLVLGVQVEEASSDIPDLYVVTLGKVTNAAGILGVGMAGSASQVAE
jgi:hypothetical protein